MSAPVLYHPTTSTWRMPPAGRPPLAGARRTNLRELAARPARFEHHLTVVARAGCAQLEMVTASEPLSFAHINVSDEYALALRQAIQWSTISRCGRSWPTRRRSRTLPGTTTASATSCCIPTVSCTGPDDCGLRTSCLLFRRRCGAAC